MNINRVKSFCQGLGFKFLSDEYTNQDGTYEFECPNGHRFMRRWKIFYRSPKSITSRYRCPQCSIDSRKLNWEEVSRRIDKLGYEYVSGVYENKNSALSVRCDKGHVWQTSANKLMYYKCPECYGAKKLGIGKLKQVGREKGFQLISDQYQGTNFRYTWKCSSGHVINRRWKTLNVCLECHPNGAKNKHSLDIFVNKAKELNFTYIGGEYKGNKEKVTFECANGHQFRVSYNKMIDRMQGCPQCNINKPEREISEFIKSIYTGPVLIRDRDALGGLELDIYLPELRIAIEHCGMYWHSDLFKSRKHHWDKRESATRAGIKVLFIYEDEWLKKRTIVESIIANALGKSKRIYARDCEFKELHGKAYFEQNHLMGAASAKQIALYYEDRIVAAISWKVIGGELHVIRFCNALNTRVVGGFSRLLSQAISMEPDAHTVVNFVDLRYGNSTAYESLGFELAGVTLGWKWTDLKHTYNRLYCRANMDERKLTQAQQAEELGLLKIYDAGQAKLIRKI